METVHSFCVQKLCKMYTTDVYKMYTIFWQTCVHILYTKSKELCQLNFIYKMYTKVCQNVVCFLYTNILYTNILYLKVCQNIGYILYANILYSFCIQKFVKIWDTFCIHFVYILYTKYIQKFVKMWDTFCI